MRMHRICITRICYTLILLFCIPVCFGADLNNTTGGLTWVTEYITCVQAAETSGMSRTEARHSCSEVVFVQGELRPIPCGVLVDPRSTTTVYNYEDDAGTWVLEWLTCVQAAGTSGMSRTEARQACMPSTP